MWLCSFFLQHAAHHPVRLLREELQLLQEPGSYVGEVIKVMGKNKMLVKVHPEGKFVVDLDKDIDVAKVCCELVCAVVVNACCVYHYTSCGVVCCVGTFHSSLSSQGCTTCV